MSERPTVGITGPESGGTAAWVFTRFAVWRSGGKAIRITVRGEVDLAQLDAVIIGGGSDISPEPHEEESLMSVATEAINEEENQPVSQRRWLDYVTFPLIYILRRLLSSKERRRLDPERDALETRVLKYALANSLPILGICRGSQLLNVHLGGTLHRDISQFYEEKPNVRSIFPRKQVKLEPQSLLSQVFQSDEGRVNALHDQAVNDVGENVKATAREANNVIQAIEYQKHPFVIGVQWHPEYLPQVPYHVALFRRLVNEAKQHRSH